MKLQKLQQNSRHRIIAQIFKAIVLSFICLVVVIAIASWGTLSSARQYFPQPNSNFLLGQRSRTISLGDIEFASIYLDGVSLFQITAPKISPSELESNGSLSPIQRRIQRIETTLERIVNTGFDPQTLEVRPATLNNLTVIVASDQKNLPQQVILTVTEIDAQLDPLSSVANLAEQRSQIIRQALIRAWAVRQPEARKRQIARVGKIMLGMITISCLLLWVQKLLKTRFKALKKRAKKHSSTDLKPQAVPPLDKADHFFSQVPGVVNTFYQEANLQKQITLNILLQKLLQIGLILLWFSSVAAILFVFPETRLQGRSLIILPLKIFIIWLALTLISNLAIIYVNYKLREWVEEGSVISDNPERRILRAPTLLEVSEGMIEFVSWCIGIIWFLAWTEILPTSFLTGAGLLGAALTFAFQNLLKDWINGILIIFEDQYAVGDMIEFQGLIGVVENMSLRATQIRTPEGHFSTIPHNQMTIVNNLTKDWSRANIIIEVAYDSDPTVVIALMKQVAQEMAGDPQWQDDIINPLNLIGVNRIAHSGLEIIMRFQVKRLRQFDVEREFRCRLKLAFDEKGIQIGVPKQSFLFQEKTEQN